MTASFIPNSFQTPNAIVDRLMFLLTDGEFRVLMYTVRHVLGWAEKRETRKATISISNYVNGFEYTDKEGTLHKYNGCGLKEAAVRAALKALEAYRILSQVGDVNQHGREWELAFMTSNNVDFVGLELRISNKDNRDKKQMGKARAVNPKINTPSVEQDYPPSVEQDYPPSVEQETTKYHLESHVETQSSAPMANSETHTDGKTVQPKLTKPEQDAWYEAVKAVWGFVEGRNKDYQKFVRGEHTDRKKKAAFIEYALVKPLTKPEQLIAWGKWQKAKAPDLNMIENLSKVQSSIETWLELQSKPVSKPVIAYANNTSTLAQAELSEQDRAAALAAFKAGRLQKASGE